MTIQEDLFTKKRNFAHFKLKGVVATLLALSEERIVTVGEAAKLHSLIKTIESFNKEFFSKSARKLAKEVYLGK